MNAPVSPSAFVPARTDIRRRDRRPVALSGYVVREGGATGGVRLLDLSYEGCGVETEGALAAGERVQLSILGRRGLIAAEVRWCAEGRAGLVFEGQEPAEKPRVERQAQRTPISAEVTLRRIGGVNYRVDVSDLSPHGCRIGLVERPSLGEQVLVRIEGLEVLEAEVCWLSGHVAGLRFARPLHPAVFDLLLQRLRAG